MDSDELFDDIADDLAVRGAVVGTMFSARALKSGGKAFALLLKTGDLAAKLGTGTPELGAALALSGGGLFDPSGAGQSWKDWAVVPAAHSDQWSHYAQAALDHLGG